jgi:lipopolysaccharide biosynthesis glycosyltransferase
MQHLPENNRAEISSKICICFIGDDNFIDGSLVMLYSLLRNDIESRGVDKVCFYDNEISVLSEKNISLLKKIDSNIIFKQVSVEPYRTFSVRFKGHNLSLLKFECFNLEHYDFVFYIDTDILILKPILGLIVELRKSMNHVFLCVENMSRSWKYSEFEFKTLAANAGFYLVKCYDYFLVKEIYERCLREVKKTAECRSAPEMVCQPIFNRVLSEINLSYISAPVSFNYRNTSEYSRFKDRIAVLHYVSRTLGKKKPWEVIYDNSSQVTEDLSVWKYYFDDVVEIVK